MAEEGVERGAVWREELLQRVEHLVRGRVEVRVRVRARARARVRVGVRVRVRLTLRHLPAHPWCSVANGAEAEAVCRC